MTASESNLVRALHSIFLLLSLSLIVPSLSSAAESPGDPKVGDAGDPDNLVFEGLQTFTDKQIRHALAVRASYLLAAHPQAELRTFLDALQQKVLAGYQAWGFPDARVDVHFDTKLEKARVSVKEGPRFKNGQIVVVGAKSSSSSELVRWFTTGATETETASSLNTPGKASRSEDPMWKTGDPADFTPGWATQAVAQVEACLAEQGFFFPQSKVELQRKDSSATADLIITIQDEGPAGVIDQIKVTGQSRHSAKDITEFLHLRKGQRLTNDRLVEARRKLRDCGRFWYFTVTPEYASDGDKLSSRRVNLLVEVKEQEGVPHLSKPLSPTQQALVRLCEWLERFPSRDEDLELKVSSTNGIPFNVRLVASPKSGLLLNSADLRGASPVSVGFQLTEKTIQLAAWASGIKIACDNHGSGVFYLTLLPNEDGGSNRFNLSFGAGYSNTAETNQTHRKSPLRFDIQITRAALLDLVNRKDIPCRVESGELLLGGENFTLRAEAKSGRLIRIDGTEGSGDLVFQIRSGTRIWNQATGDFERRATPLTNIYVPGRGFTTFLSLAAAEVVRWKLTTSMNSRVAPDERARAASAMRKLLDPELLAPVDRYFSGNETNEFTVPSDDTDLAMAQNQLLAFFAGYAFELSRELFPKHSWPWTLSRESVFVIMNQGRYTAAELDRLCNSDETGPIGFLAIAHLLAKVNPDAARQIAVQGLTRLSANSFLSDCNLFLRGDSGLARSFTQFAQTLRTIPDDELAALLNTLPENEATLLRESATVLRAQPHAPLDSALSPAVSEYWDKHLRAEVRTAFLKLTRPKNQDEAAK